MNPTCIWQSWIFFDRNIPSVYITTLSSADIDALYLVHISGINLCKLLHSVKRRQIYSQSDRIYQCWPGVQWFSRLKPGVKPFAKEMRVKVSEDSVFRKLLYKFFLFLFYILSALTATFVCWNTDSGRHLPKHVHSFRNWVPSPHHI